MHFLLSSMSVVYVLTTHIPEDGDDDPTVKQVRKRVKLGHIYFKRMQDMSKDRLIPAFDMDTKKYKTCMLTKITKKPFQNVARETNVLELIHSELYDLHATPSLRNKKYYVTFINDAFRFGYVYLLQLKDEALDTFKVLKTKVELQQGSQIKRFRTDRGVPRPSLRIPNGTENIGGSVVPKEVTEKVVQQPEPELRKSKRNNKNPKNFGSEFQLYLIKGIRDEGFKQNSGIDYFDTYAPVARISTIRLLIAMASIHNLIIHQMDVKTAFLNGDLEEEVYMNQPQGFIMHGNENKVCKLIKSLYRLKQAPKQWHQKFDEVVLSNGYLLNQADKCVYSKFDESVLYEGHGKAHVILGIRIKHGSKKIAISQSHYIEKVLKKFNYFDCTPVSTPMDTSKKLMPNNGQRVLKYLKKTMDYRLTYTGYSSVLEGYADASWISNTEDNSSTSGWVFLLGGGAIS
nr:hypothetical protein [Tanacetum cinerariifolium]